MWTAKNRPREQGAVRHRAAVRSCRA